MMSNVLFMLLIKLVYLFLIHGALLTIVKLISITLLTTIPNSSFKDRLCLTFLTLLTNTAIN